MVLLEQARVVAVPAQISHHYEVKFITFNIYNFMVAAVVLSLFAVVVMPSTAPAAAAAEALQTALQY